MRLRHSAILFVIAFLACCASPPPAASPPAAPTHTARFDFTSNGNRLSGLFDTPASEEVRGLIVIIHGYGETDVTGRTSYLDLRRRFNALGVSTLIWDKPGNGQSEGMFDPDQPVASSAQEVLDAIAAARARNMPGSHRVGLWGISRAGWIAPLAIQQDPEIAFWISVSGTDEKENFPYLLASNLRIEGRNEAQIARLVEEWRRGFEIMRSGGSFSDYMAATENLRGDPFMRYLNGGREDSEADFRAYQQQFLSGAFEVDEASGLMIYVPGFAQTLARVDIPVLAIFGERDRNVDWRASADLYRRTIGANPRAALTIRTFPDANHNIHRAETGGLRELIEMPERVPADGYFETMETWLEREALN